MIVLILVAIISVASLAIARAFNKYYNSPRNFYRNVISPRGIERMHEEQWYSAITPVIIVRHPNEPPPESPYLPERRWP